MSVYSGTGGMLRNNSGYLGIAEYIVLYTSLCMVYERLLLKKLCYGISRDVLLDEFHPELC